MAGDTTELEIPETGLIDDQPAEPVAPAPDRPQNPRDVIAAKIAARYEEQQRAAEIAYGEQLSRDAAERDAPPPAQEPPEAAPEPVAASEPAPDPAAPTQAPPAPEQPQLRTVMVGGQPIQVTEEQLYRLASDGAYANLALQQNRQPAQPQPAPAPVQQPYALDRDKAREIHHRLSYGNEEEGIAALQEWHSLLPAPSAPQVDPQVIAAQAAQAAYDRIRLENDLNTIGQEFPEIFGNRSLSFAATAHLVELRQRDAMLGIQRPPIEQYREAANMVRQAFPPAPQSQPAVGTSPVIQAAPTPDRLERKRAAPRQPAPVSRVASLGDDTPRAPTGSEIVNQIRKARHQPIYS